MDPREVLKVAERLMEDYCADEEACFLLNTAHELSPENEEIVSLLAMTLVRLEKFEDARRLLADLPETGDSDTLNARAIAQAASFDLAGAVKTLERALALDPGAAYMWANRGLFRFYDGSYEEAALDLVRSCTISKGMFVDSEHGSQRPEYGDFRPLLRGFKKIREETGKDLLAFKLIGAWAELARGKPRRAEALLAKLSVEEQASWAVPALRAACSKAVRKSTEKREAGFLREARSRAPDEVTLVLRLGELECVENDETRALHEDLIRLAPDWPQSWIKVGASRSIGKDPQGALAALDRAVELAPGLWDALSLRATVRYRNGDLMGALEDFTTIIDLFGDDRPDPDEDEWDRPDEEISDIYCHRAQVRYDMRDLAAAEADYALAVAKARPWDWVTFYRRAEFLARLGRRAEALEDLDASISHEGDVEDVLKLRARLREKTGNPAGAAADRKVLTDRYATREAYRKQLAEHRAKLAKKKKAKKKGKKS